MSGSPDGDFSLVGVRIDAVAVRDGEYIAIQCKQLDEHGTVLP